MRKWERAKRKKGKLQTFQTSLVERDGDENGVEQTERRAISLTMPYILCSRTRKKSGVSHFNKALSDLGCCWNDLKRSRLSLILWGESFVDNDKRHFKPRKLTQHRQLFVADLFTFISSHFVGYVVVCSAMCRQWFILFFFKEKKKKLK